jgi:hypothetical protein
MPRRARRRLLPPVCRHGPSGPSPPLHRALSAPDRPVPGLSGRVRPVRKTWAPSETSRCAVARPMPELPPVIRALSCCRVGPSAERTAPVVVDSAGRQCPCLRGPPTPGRAHTWLSIALCPTLKRLRTGGKSSNRQAARALSSNATRNPARGRRPMGPSLSMAGIYRLSTFPPSAGGYCGEARREGT